MWDEFRFSAAVSGLLSAGVLAGIVLFARPFIGIFLGRSGFPRPTCSSCLRRCSR